MHKIITRGPKTGTCNICGEYGLLTADHTPPKGAISLTQVEMKSIVELLAAVPPGKHGRVSQNGVKFRSLCGRCNNGLLGACYDPAFIEFTQQIGNYLKTSVVLPSSTSAQGKPTLISRAVLGHLAAIGVNRYDKGPHTDEFRNYMLDETLPMPDWIEIYYWVYPYKIQVLVRDAVISDFRNSNAVNFWLMKFFPVAFFVIWDPPSDYIYPNLSRLSRWRTAVLENEVDLPIRLKEVPHERWPEAPEENGAVLFGDSAMGVWEKRKGRKRS